MSAKKSPLENVKAQFGSKEKLVDALVELPIKVIDRKDDEDKDALHKRLSAAANSKLLHLYKMGQDIQKRWGSKEQLVDAILNLQNRSKDADYRKKLGQQTVGRLYDQAITLERAGRRNKAA